MYTLIKIILFAISFILLFLYELFHIKNMIKFNQKRDQLGNISGKYSNTAKYKKIATIAYSIVNIFVILFFCFSFQEYTFFSIVKLVWLLIITAIFICICFICAREEEEKEVSILITILWSIILVTVVTIFFVSLNTDFSETINTKVSNSKITNVTSIGKFNDYYLISYRENNKNKQKIINLNKVKEIVYENKVCIYTDILTYTKINPEDKICKAYNETKNLYTIYCPKDYITDLN